MGVVAAAVSEISIRDEAECWITWSERQDIVDAKVETGLMLVVSANHRTAIDHMLN